MYIPISIGEEEDRLCFPISDQYSARLAMDILNGNPLALAWLYLALGHYPPRGGAGTDFVAEHAFLVQNKGWDSLVVFVKKRLREKKP